jgi:hypothetical protein
MRVARNYCGSIALIALLVCCAVQAQVINKDVTRTIDAGSAIVRISAEIKAVNVAGEYQFAFPTNEAKSLSYLSVALKGKVLPLSAPVRFVLRLAPFHLLTIIIRLDGHADPRISAPPLSH